MNTLVDIVIKFNLIQRNMVGHVRLKFSFFESTATYSKSISFNINLNFDKCIQITDLFKAFFNPPIYLISLDIEMPVVCLRATLVKKL